jgi:hypothetical protein
MPRQTLRQFSSAWRIQRIGVAVDFSRLKLSTDWRGGTCPYKAISGSSSNNLSPDSLEYDWLAAMHRKHVWGMHFQVDAAIIGFMQLYVESEAWEALYRDLLPFVVAHRSEPKSQPGMLRNAFFYFARMRKGDRIVAARGATYHAVGFLRDNTLTYEQGYRFPYQRNVDWVFCNRSGWPAPIAAGEKVPAGHLTTIYPLFDKIYKDDLDKICKAAR